jgi:chromate transporter
MPHSGRGKSGSASGVPLPLITPVLPGPEAQQLAIYIGWLMHRIRGGIVSEHSSCRTGDLGILSWVYAAYGEVAWVAALFAGLKAAVLAIVLDAVIRIGRRALKSRALVGVAAWLWAIF